MILCVVDITTIQTKEVKKLCHNWNKHAILITRSIVKGLDASVNLAESLAEGNFSKSIDNEYVYRKIEFSN
jgi:hypothetical protein